VALGRRAFFYTEEEQFSLIPDPWYLFPIPRFLFPALLFLLTTPRLFRQSPANVFTHPDLLTLMALQYPPKICRGALSHLLSSTSDQFGRPDYFM